MQTIKLRADSSTKNHWIDRKHRFNLGKAGTHECAVHTGKETVAVKEECAKNFSRLNQFLIQLLEAFTIQIHMDFDLILLPHFCSTAIPD